MANEKDEFQKVLFCCTIQVGVCVTPEQAALPAEELRAVLTKKLPAYMGDMDIDADTIQEVFKVEEYVGHTPILD